MSFFFFWPVHAVHGVLKARMLKWFAIPFSNRPRFVRTLHRDPSVLGGPTLNYWTAREVPSFHLGKKKKSSTLFMIKKKILYVNSSVQVLDTQYYKVNQY